MKAMLLAAGRGERLRPLTDHCPKPLIEVAGRSLIEHALAGLAQAGVSDCVINLNWLGEQIEQRLGKKGPGGMRLHYSWERGERLETGGGIFRVLAQFADAPFVVVNADVFSDYDLSRLASHAAQFEAAQAAHLVLVDNPAHHPQGDFALAANGQVSAAGEPRLTFAGISLLHPRLFAGCQPGRFALAPLLRAAMATGAVRGEHHSGLWTDVGSPQRLQLLRQQLGDG